MYWLPTAYNAVWMNAYLSKQINRKLTKLISKCSDQYNFDQQTDEQWKCAFVYRPLYWSSVGQHGHDDAVKATRVFHCINRSEMIMRSRKINIFFIYSEGNFWSFYSTVYRTAREINFTGFCHDTKMTCRRQPVLWIVLFLFKFILNLNIASSLDT